MFYQLGIDICIRFPGKFWHLTPLPLNKMQTHKKLVLYYTYTCVFAV